ncbi:MAG: hypothetical protein ACC726_16745, partial [Chloroflexota bacterium]
GTTMSAADLQSVADWLVRTEEPATWMHALMDLGATVCRPRQPRCEDCPLSGWCDSAGPVAAEQVVAGMQASGRGSSGSGVPFKMTTRWLRGRIVARLLDIDEGQWVELPASVGAHGPGQVATAVAALEDDGLLERRSDGAVRLPSVAR